MTKEINMFVIYAREDKNTKLDLLRHLNPFKEAFNLSIWHDDQIEPGQLWKPHIESRLNFTDVFLLLVSVDFMNSQFIKQTEFKAAIDRHKENKSIVIPVIIDYCQWDIDFTLIDYTFNINELQVLPDDAKPIGDWNSPDQAYNNIAAGVRKVLTSIQNKRKQETKEIKDIDKGKAEEEKRLADAAAAKIKAEEEKRIKQEAEIKRKAEEEKRIKQEAEAKRKAEEEKRLKKEAEAKRKAEEHRVKEKQATTMHAEANKSKTQKDSNKSDGTSSIKKIYKRTPIVIVSIIAIILIVLWIANSGEDDIEPSITEQDQIEHSNNTDEIDAWNEALENNSIQSFDTYLQDYPDGFYASEAINKIDALVDNKDWEAAVSSNTIAAYQLYGQNHPNGAWLEDAKQKIKDIENQEKLNVQDQESQRLANAAKAEENYWKSVKYYNTVANYQSYQAKYPNGKYFNEATAQIKAIRDEEKAWNAALSSNSVQSYSTYLQKYSSSPHSQEAKSKIAAIQKLQNQEVKITFQNVSNASIEVFWDNSGVETKYGVLEAGKSYVQSTFLNHVWKFKQNGVTVGTFTVNQGDQTIKIGNSDNSKIINGRNVQRVVYSLGNNNSAMFYKYGSEWLEASMSNEINFRFTETGRDDWSVYLYDASRKIYIQLDLYRLEVWYSDVNTPRRFQYKIIEAY